MFNRIQELIVKNKKSPARKKADDEYILTTKLYCGKCMTFMVGESGTARNQNTYRYYKCLSAKRKSGCDKKAIKKESIENIKKPMLTKDQIVFWFYRLRKTDVTNATHRKRLVDSFVNAIIVHDDRLEFYFNYKDGATTLSVKDLENSSDLVNSLPPKGAVTK